MEEEKVEEVEVEQVEVEESVGCGSFLKTEAYISSRRRRGEQE